MPAARLDISAPNVLIASGLIISPGPVARFAKKGAKGSFSSISTVESSTTVTLLIAFKYSLAGVSRLGSSSRSRLTFTASALKGDPSWNRTPLRRLKRYFLPPSLAVQLVANPGANCGPPV